MTDRVNGGVAAGEFLTGNMDFFTIQTIVPVEQTNVETPVADLYQISSTVWSPVTVVNGTGTAVTYATQAAYEDALKKQANLNTFISVFAGRANPVAIGVGTSAVAAANVAGFGSTYTGAKVMATINIATERSGLWYTGTDGNFSGTAADNTNINGYLLETALNGVAIVDVAAGVINAPDVIDTSSASLKNTLVSRRALL